MSEPTLVVDALLVAFSALALGAVARALWRRQASAHARVPLRLFAVWWGAAAASMVVAAVARGAAGMGVGSLPLYEASLLVTLPATCLAAYGLVGYLIFLITGRRPFVPLAVAYGLLYVAVLYYVVSSDLLGVETGPWTFRYVLRAELAGWPFALSILSLAAPPILGAVAYLQLYFRVDDAAQRWRIGLVGAALFAMASGFLLSPDLALVRGPWSPPASRILQLAGALVLVLAYNPPAFVRRRFFEAAENASA